MNIFKGNVLTGLMLGIGATVLSPVIIPVIASIVKPLTKATIKGGMIACEKGKEALAEIGEVVEDIVAEAKSEVEESAVKALHSGLKGGPK